MSRMLDIDMDFFLDKIAICKSGEERLKKTEYAPWNETNFRSYLEEQCKLSKVNKIQGRIIKNHDEAFYFWEQLIKNKDINYPFKITHIDAHTDLKAGYPSDGLTYILGKLLHMDIDERLNNFDSSKMGLANYLSFAIACGFFDEVELVMHPDYDYSDLPNPFFKNNDYRLNLLEMKAYSEHNLSYTIFDSPVNKDSEIPFQIIQGCEFRAQHNYDYVVFCQSPGYTPKTADFMLDVIEEYIIEI